MFSPCHLCPLRCHLSRPLSTRSRLAARSVRGHCRRSMPARSYASMVEHDAAAMGPECAAATFPVSKTPEPQKRHLMCPDEFQQVLFIECGHGADQHGQNATVRHCHRTPFADAWQKAAVRACRNAIEFNSIPCIQQIVPNGYAGMQIHVKIGVPDPETVDKAAVKAVFPYGRICCVDVVEGGLRANSGIAVAALGDKNDDWFVAVASVTVGY